MIRFSVNVLGSLVLTSILGFSGLVLQGCSSDNPPVQDNMRTIPVETISISGTLVDSFCYSKLSADERAAVPVRVDADCAERSMKQGFPLIVVVDTSEVWLLSENPRLLRDALNDSVRVIGDIRSEGVLIPRKVSGKIDGDWSVIIDPESTYLVSGIVTRLTAERDLLIVRHDEIEGYMGAMTMPFTVRDTSLVSGVSAGDSIRFSIQVIDGDARLNAVQFIAVGTPQ